MAIQMTQAPVPLALTRFTEDLALAVRTVPGVGLIRATNTWPRTPGGPLRLHVPANPTGRGGGFLDPIGLVYLHRTGRYMGLLQGLEAALALGLAPELAVRVLDACDRATEDPEGQRWRTSIIRVLDQCGTI